jgi:hypothetical protein
MTTSVNITAFRKAILDLRNSQIPSNTALESAKVFARELLVIGETTADNLIFIEREGEVSSEVLQSLDQPMLFHKWSIVEATDSNKNKYKINSKGKLVVKFVKDLRLESQKRMELA